MLIPGGTEERKIHWFKWEELCEDFRSGGLGVKNLEWFNIALTSKWIWRFLVERDLLWVRVIKACHGDVNWDGDGFRAQGSRVMRAGWWNKILGLSQGEGGKWLRDNLQLQVGEGNDFLFWHHWWVGEGRLKDLFPRLYSLNSNQGGTIKSMGEWTEGGWVWNLTWNRELFDRENVQIQNLYSIISGASLVAGSRDGWKWKTNANGIYSVNSAYKTLCSGSNPNGNNSSQTEMASIWKAPAPIKAITTAWKVLKGRLPTCDNLLRRNVNISQSEAICVLCKSHPETINHLFFSCHKSAETWYDLLQWIGKQTALHSKAKEQLHSFINLGKKTDVSFLIGAWICVIWSIWNGRNECKFNQRIWNREKVLAEIKSRLWGWKLAYNFSTSATDFRSWFLAAKLFG